MALVKDVTFPTDNGLLSCSICLGPFNQPKVLPCLHTFCKPCLEKLEKDCCGVTSPSIGCTDLITLAQHVEISCPQCKAVHRTQAELLPTDYWIQHAVAIRALSSDDDKGDAITCGSCDEVGHAPVAYCRPCRSFVCQSCYAAHQRMKTLKNHSVVLMADFDLQMLPVDIYCTSHKEELLSRYCRTCGVSICRECTPDSHYKHEILTTNGAKEQVKERLQELHQVVAAGLQQFRGHLELIRKMEDHIVQYEEHLKTAVNNSCDLAIKNVKATQRSLVLRIGSTYKEHAKRVWAEKDMVERTILDQEGCLAFTERLLKSNNDTEMVFLSSQVIERLNKLKESSWDAKSIELPSLVYNEKVTVTIGDIAEIKNCIQKIKISDTTIVPGKDYSISIIPVENILYTPSITANAEIKQNQISQLQEATMKCKIEHFDATKKCWDGTFSFGKDGNYTMIVTVIAFGKTFGTAVIDFPVSTVRHKSGLKITVVGAAIG